MANDDGGEKTEEPTGRKLQQAREKGQVPKSMEMTSVLVLLAAGLSLVLLGPIGWDRLSVFFYRYIWNIPDVDVADGSFIPWFYGAMQEVLILVIPLALIIMAVSVAVSIFQVGGFMIVSDAIVPKIEKLNFIQGFGKFFKLKSIVDCFKSIAKIALIIYMCYSIIGDHLDEFADMGDMEVAAIGALTLKIALEIFIKTCLVLLILAVLDYGYQKWQFMRDMRMSKQEITDEYKQTDGDPPITSRIRQAQREASKKRQLADVPSADVVVANPTHFAIALVYDAEKAQAPIVVAKGQDFMALRIKEIAKEAKVPIVENKPLAQALYKVVEVGQMIPAEFYKAVAEVLSYVYRVKGRRKKKTQ